MNAMGNLFRISPISTRQIAQVADVGVYEAKFRIGKASGKDTSRVCISYQNVLPSPTENNYINIDEACRETGINSRELIELCEQGKIEAINNRGNWLILRASLDQYMRKDRTT